MLQKSNICLKLQSINLESMFQFILVKGIQENYTMLY